MAGCSGKLLVHDIGKGDENVTLRRQSGGQQQSAPRLGKLGLIVLVDV